jgi:hypothetical protein
MSEILDQFGHPVSANQNVLIDRPRAMMGGSYGGGVYDALQFSANRATRPFFATDSRYTLTAWKRLQALSLSRWAYINVPFVRAAVDLMARLSVGTGFTCHSLARDTGWGRQADWITANAFKNIGFTGGESMDELLMHDCRGCDVDGDLGYVMTEDENQSAKLQLIEGHRIKKGDVTDEACVDGVWFDAYARRVGYNVLLPGENERTRAVAVQNFIYMAERNRPDEVRTMGAMVHALAPIQDLYEMLGFEMSAVKKNSEIGLTVETPTPDRPPLGPPVDIFQQGAVAGVGDQPGTPKQYVTREMIYGGGGKVVVLGTGEKLMAHDHKRPGSGIENWSKFIIRGIAAGYGLPFEVLWDPEAIGGANTRMITALLRARLEQRRETLIFPKLARVRFWVLARAIKRGELPFNPDITKVEFQPNFYDITVDAGRESRERRANVLQGLDTFTGFFAEDGKSYADQLKVREEEIGAQCEAAERLTQKFPGLSFSAALARIAMLTPNANEASAGKGAEGKPKDAKAKAGKDDKEEENEGDQDDEDDTENQDE